MATLSELITTLKGKMLPLAGGTLTGALTAPSVSITNDNAKVNGKNIVRSVNGTVAGTDGNVAMKVGDASESDILEAADKALETVTNVGNTDIADVLSAVASVESNLSAKLETSTVHIVETWSSGASWYRKYSDGWIEQGGTAKSWSGVSDVTFSKSFSNTNYQVVAYPRGTYCMGAPWFGVIDATTTSCRIAADGYDGDPSHISWVAFGY